MNTEPVKTAAYWLDRACAMENEGKAHAEVALNRAVKLDIEEHSADSATASLPRK